MKKITLLHPGRYTGFSGVRFPVEVQAEPYRYGDNGKYILDGMMIVSDAELLRIGYDGPLIDGLHFSTLEGHWQEFDPFDYWNRLKASRPVGALSD